MTAHRPYYCPTAADTECCPEHSGFDVCCDRPDLHVDLTDEQVLRFWDTELAGDVAGIPDRGAVEQMRTRWLAAMRANPEALRQVGAWLADRR